MTKYYTADMHLDHINVLKLSNRPFDNGEHMQQSLIDNWNSVVTKADDVYHIGDFCFNPDTFIKFIGELSGTKHFITGNHDSKAIKRLVRMKKEGCKPLKRVHFHGDIHTVKDSNYMVVLCHYPLYEWNGYHRGSIHLHGHTHGNIGRSNYNDKAFDVGVDVFDFKPVTLQEILLYK